MPKKRASSRSASSVSSSGSASSSLNVNATMSSSTTTTSTGGDESESSSPSSGINNLPTTGGVIGGIQLTPAMIREFMEASKKAGIDLHAGVVNERGNMRHVTGDLNKLVAMTNASSNHAAAAAAAAQAAANNNNITNTTARGKVTGVKIVRQTVPFVGPPLPPGHVSSSSSSTTSTSSQKGGKKTLAMGVSATFSKPDGSTATVELDPAAIAAMMAQANSNNPEAFNAGLKQILAAATTTTACAPVTYAGTAQQQQQQQQRIMDSSRRVMSSSATGTTTRNSLLANKIASSYGGSTSEDDNTKNNISSSKTTSSTKKSSINNNNNSQQQQNMAQMQSLFASLFSMAQQMDSSSSSSSTSSSSQDPLQNEFALFRKAAFVAGVNVAIQQEAEREAQHEMEKMNKSNQQQQQQQLQQQQQKNKTDASQQQGIKQKQQQQQQQQQQKSKKKESATGGNNATSTAKSNVFSMIFGGGGNKSNATSATAPTTSSTTSSSVSTNNGSSSTRNSASSSTTAVVPVIPPPPGGFPQDSLVSQAASVLADYGNDDDKNLNLAVSLGNRLLKSVNMSLETEDDARRAYEKVTSCLSPEERSIVDSFATNFVDLPDNNNEGGAGAAGGFGCSPEELINVMSKSMASVMNLDNPGVIARLAQEIDRVKRNNNPPLPQDRPTFEHLPPDDADKAQKISREKKQKAEEEELRKRNEEEEAEAEEEERKRELKASKRRDKKARQKERLKKEAEVKAAAAAIKKREKTITSWRSRVIAACLSGDARKMDLLIGESPYKNYIFNPSLSEEANDETNDEDGSGGDDYGGGGGGGPQNQEEYMVQQLNWFLPNCLQKYPTRGASFDTPPFQFNVARELLAKYIISTSFDVFRQPVPTFSRTSIHSAAYANDVDFIKWVLHSSKDNERDFLESQCTDAGWTPLHYATAGGAKSALELLLSEKCNVKARSTPSLTCFRTFTPYQSSNGITARELAVVLQAGAVDDDLTSKAAILDEIVDKRIVNASAADKSSYMRILKSIEERLKEVEKNGYWPLPEDEEQIALIFEETASESTPTLKKKSKKKNKKKSKESNLPSNSAAASASSTAEAEGASNEKSSSGGDLSDPVAVALLSMGFAEDQIKAAAKAFGGYVGADDMVMWILSGGDVSAIDQTNTNSQQTSPTRKESVSVTSSSTKSASAKTQPKALTRAQKKAEEAARKRQEEIANAQKAAAKREEQRRLRREWNEREQARQQEEKNAKLAKALEKQRQAEMEKIMAEMPKGPPGPGGIPMSINIGGGGGGGGGAGGSGKGGPPITIVAGGKKSSKKSNMGIPQAPTVKAPKILARPNDASKNSVGDQPLFAKPAPSKSSSRASKPSNSSTHQPTVILKKGNKSQSAQKGFSASAPEYHPPSVSDVSISSAGSAGQQLYQGQGGRPVPPPGFLPVVPGNNAAEQPAATPFVEPNHVGMIRATAREFVPSFAPSPMSEVNVVPSMSAQSSSKQPSFSQTISSYENTSNAPPPAVSSLIEPMSSLLSNVNSSLAPTTLAQTVGVDPTVSAASSITGLSGTLSEDKPSTSRVGSIMTFESNTSTGVLQGSSILESISYGASADPRNGLGSIWGGGSSSTNQNDALGGLGSFNFSSFMQDESLSEKKGDSRGSNTLGGNALGDNSSPWGNGAIGGDSIW